jgi:hypothetical protein
MRPVCHACHNGFTREKVGPLIDESRGVHEREEGWCFQQRTATQEYPATRLSAGVGILGRSHDVVSRISTARACYADIGIICLGPGRRRVVTISKPLEWRLGAAARGALCCSVGASPERRIFPKSSGARAAGTSALPWSRLAARRLTSCNTGGQVSARNISTIDAGA